jgi:hypothetical protein
MPRLLAAGLKIHVGAVNAVMHDLVKHVIKRDLVHAGGRKDQIAGDFDGAVHDLLLQSGAVE